jgi:uncharacterized protein YhdP
MERLTRILAAFTRWGLGLCALVLVLMALYVSLGRELTPLVAEYRADIEDKASAALGMPLQIGELEGNWSGFAPILLAHDVMVGDGANALRLDRVRAVPDLWASLLAREVRIAHLELNGLKISLKEAEDGSWVLEGLPVQNDQPLDAQQLFNRSQMIQQLSVLDSQVTLQPFGSPATDSHLCRPQSENRRQPSAARCAFDLAGWPACCTEPAHANSPRAIEGQCSRRLRQSAAKRLVEVAAGTPYSTMEFFRDQGRRRALGHLGQGHTAKCGVHLNAPQLTGAYADRKPIQINNLALNAYYENSAEGATGHPRFAGDEFGENRWESHVQLKQTRATDKV